MKTRNFVLTALALIVAVTASATKIPTLNVIRVENNKALVAFGTFKPVSLEVTVTNEMGKVLYYKMSENPVDKYQMILDFKDLEDGNYDVAIDFHNTKINREITISNNQLAKVGEAEKAYGPYYHFEDDLLKVSFLNITQSKVQMEIFKDGVHIAGKNLGKEMTIQKVFDFSKLESGDYDVVLTDRRNDYQFVVHK